MTADAARGDPGGDTTWGMSSLFRFPALVTRPVITVLDATAALAALPRRVVEMVIEVEQTLAAVNAATKRTDALIDRIDDIASRAEGAVYAAYETVGAAAAAIKQASAITATAAPLLESYSEPLRLLEPTVRRLADTTDAREVDALVKLIERLPRLVNAMDDDVMPLLDRLDQSGPDLNQLLDSVSDLNRMAGRLPKVFRRRRAGS
jgi:ABC-type transporter Mla subunit MlaD